MACESTNSWSYATFIKVMDKTFFIYFTTKIHYL